MEHLARQLLTCPRADAVEVVEHLLAVQAQDPVGARLAIRARSTGLTARDVDAALDDRRLVITTLNRGTLHLVRSADYWWLQQLTTPRLAVSNATRLRQLGVDQVETARGVRQIVAELADGPLGRTELRQRLRDAGALTDGQAFIHLIYQASIEGLIVRGPMVHKEHGFVLVRDWLGAPPRAWSADEALDELGRRYLRAHAPADERDLAVWAGITLSAARRALRDAVAPRLVSRVHAAPPRLLGPWDELIMGWASRDPVLGDNAREITVGGMFHPFALLDGRAVGRWRVASRELTFFEEVDPALFAAELADVDRFLAR